MSRQGPAGRFNAFYSNADPHGTYKANDQTTAMPKTLRCVFCDEDKQLDAFSKSQIARVTYNPWAPSSYNNKKPKTVCCKKCTAKQTQMLTCASCTRTKPLESFAKNQRRNAHKARCLKCMKKREEEDVHDSEPDDSDSSGSDHETWDDWLHA